MAKSRDSRFSTLNGILATLGDKPKENCASLFAKPAFANMRHIVERCRKFRRALRHILRRRWAMLDSASTVMNFPRRWTISSGCDIDWNGRLLLLVVRNLAISLCFRHTVVSESRRTFTRRILPPSSLSCFFFSASGILTRSSAWQKTCSDRETTSITVPSSDSPSTLTRAPSRIGSVSPPRIINADTTLLTIEAILPSSTHSSVSNASCTFLLPRPLRHSTKRLPHSSRHSSCTCLDPPASSERYR
mmetsp:Transcript_10852/g.21281  ORF Transcript_10852/g.21281 Transcript_10852/m.21281 type:complete len:247 (+) Transcript_10852:790-1530(+)